MTPRALSLLLLAASALLIAALIGCVVIQRADYRQALRTHQAAEETHRVEFAQLMDVLGRKAVLVQPTEMDTFQRAADANTSKTKETSK